LTALHEMGAALDQPLRAQPELLLKSLSVPVKSREDQLAAKEIVERKDW
jgi:hypothetical protein